MAAEFGLDVVGGQFVLKGKWICFSDIYVRAYIRGGIWTSLFRRKFNSAGIKTSMEISFFSESTDVLN